MRCKTCAGKGVVLANLNDFGFGRGFREFMSAGCLQRQNDDGSNFHEIVCPRCDGVSIVLPEPEEDPSPFTPNPKKV